jgi:hypothetical protein
MNTTTATATTTATQTEDFGLMTPEEIAEHLTWRASLRDLAETCEHKRVTYIDREGWYVCDICKTENVDFPE